VAEQLKPQSEPELWNELVQAQQGYAQSLASLDEMIFGDTPSGSLSLGQRLIEDGARVRRAAYARYRQAMDELTEYLRR
jgi:hypothetical protein